MRSWGFGQKIVNEPGKPSQSTQCPARPWSTLRGATTPGGLLTLVSGGGRRSRVAGGFIDNELPRIPWQRARRLIAQGPLLRLLERLADQRLRGGAIVGEHRVPHLHARERHALGDGGQPVAEPRRHRLGSLGSRMHEDDRHAIASHAADQSDARSSGRMTSTSA